MEWTPFILEIFSKYRIKNSKQYVYKLPHKDSINLKISRPLGYDVFEINNSFVNNELMMMENRDVIFTKIEKTWACMDKFIEYGKGFVATQNNKICGFSKTGTLYKNVYSIGVETFEPHRQKGLSSFLSMSLISNIVNQGASVWWDCMESNIASQRTAQKVGLTFDHEYEIFWFDIE